MARVECIKSKYQECDDANIVVGTRLEISSLDPGDNQIMNLSTTTTSITKKISVIHINGGWLINLANNNFTVPETGTYLISYSTAFNITAMGGGASKAVMITHLIVDGTPITQSTVENASDTLDRIDYVTKTFMVDLKFGQILRVDVIGFSATLTGVPTGNATVNVGQGSDTHLMAVRIL